MKGNKVKIGFAISSIVLFILLTVANRPLRGQEDNLEAAMTKKLDQILENQGKILEQIESMKETLRIIQVRVTR